MIRALSDGYRFLGEGEVVREGFEEIVPLPAGRAWAPALNLGHVVTEEEARVGVYREVSDRYLARAAGRASCAREGGENEDLMR